jgi:hypothetical protein
VVRSGTPPTDVRSAMRTLLPGARDCAVDRPRIGVPAAKGQPGAPIGRKRTTTAECECLPGPTALRCPALQGVDGD